MIATPIGKNMIGIYDQDISARPYNPSMSLALLTEVFGKTYNKEIQDETYTTIPYFEMILISPIANQARTQWTTLIAQSFRDIGIDVTLKWPQTKYRQYKDHKEHSIHNNNYTPCWCG